MMHISLEGQTALVSGAGRGLGRAIALKLAQSGAHVVAVSRTAADLDELVGMAPAGKIEPLVCDVLDDTFYKHIEAMKRIDILVNNAGGNKPMLMVDVDDATLDSMIALNVRSVYKTSQAAARNMTVRKSGVIINISSQMGRVGSPRRTVYCMTKHAVEGLTKAMAVELAPSGVRVVSVAPTFVVTPMTEPMFANPEFSAFVMDRIPLGRLATPDDVASAVVFLASPAAGLITGESLAIDGGWTAQ